VIGLVNEVSDMQDNLRDTAQSLGVSVEFLSGWGQAAELAGSNGSEFAQSLVFISKSAAAAADEIRKGDPGPSAQAYQRLGVSVLDSAGKMKPLEQITREVQAGLARLPATADRVGVAVDVLGRSGASQLAFFGQATTEIDDYVARLQAMGAITTTGAANQADAWNDLRAELEDAWGGVRQQLAEPIRDSLMPYLESVLDWVRTNPEGIRAAAKAVADTVIKGLNGMATAARVAWPVVQGIIENLGPIGFVLAAGLAVRAITGLVTAFRTLSTAAAIAKAISGPAGWATLAVGIGVAAAAVSTIEQAYDRAAVKASDFAKSAGDATQAASPPGGGSASSASPAKTGAGFSPPPPSFGFAAAPAGSSGGGAAPVDLSGLVNAASAAAAGLSVVGPAGKDAGGGLQIAQRSAEGFARVMDDLVARVSRSTGGGGGTRGESGSDLANRPTGTGGAAVQFGDVNVTVPLDLNEATTRMAEKIRPLLIGEVDRRFRELETAAHAQRVRGAMTWR
jgi:hypothetical protein